MQTRRSRRYHRKIKEKNKSLKYKTAIVVFVILCASIYYFKFSPRYWNGINKISVVVKEQEEISVIVFDPLQKEVIQIQIPRNTQVDVSRQLGVWRLGSVWKLGENEGYRGDLLTDTITKNFNFPVFLWIESSKKGITGQSIVEIIRFYLLNKNSNIPFLDKLAITFFSIGVKNTARVNVDLSKTSYLEQEQLKGGEDGYIIKEKIPEKIASYFSEPLFQENATKVVIRDATGSWGVSRSFAKTMEVLGANVVAVIDEPEAGSNCIVNANDKYIKYFSKLFKCEPGNKRDNGMEIEVFIGREFAKTY